MLHWLRRLVLITLVGSVAGAVVVRLRRTTSGTGAVSNAPSTPVAVTRDPTWPPLHRDATTPASPAALRTTQGVAESLSSSAAGEGPPKVASDTVANDNGRCWIRPDENGACPAGYPVKANDNSGIFHLPGGRFYDRTKPERCYSDAVVAAADGYRAAKA